jgi:hypothetical protein
VKSEGNVTAAAVVADRLDEFAALAEVAAAL